MSEGHASLWPVKKLLGLCAAGAGMNRDFLLATAFVPRVSHTKSLMVSDARALFAVAVPVESFSSGYCLYTTCFHGTRNCLTVLEALLLFFPPAHHVGWTELEHAEVVTERRWGGTQRGVSPGRPASRGNWAPFPSPFWSFAMSKD